MNCPRCLHILREGARFCDNCGAPVASSGVPTGELDAETLRDDPLVGQILDGKYELLVRLGEGGMGAVYRAGRVHIGDEVAVKVLLRQFVADAASIERFRREARAAARLHHQNVVAIYDYGETGGGDAPAYIVMELLEGISLRRLLKQEYRLTPERAVALMCSICAGVGSAHRRGVFHRDLKPDNVIVLAPNEDREGESVKVVDFGIAKLRDPAGAPTLTETGALVGTPHYMSPEQCRGEPLDARSDVYSLGAMLYEMLVGSPPFTAETVTGVMAKHLFDPPPHLPIKLGVATAVEGVIMRALAKDPDERPAEAATFARELQEALIRSHEEEEEARRAEEERLRVEQARAQADEERRLAEAEALRQAEEEAARLREEEERRERDEAERQRREAEAERRRREAEERAALKQRRPEEETPRRPTEERGLKGATGLIAPGETLWMVRAPGEVEEPTRAGGGDVERTPEGGVVNPEYTRPQGERMRRITVVAAILVTLVAALSAVVLLYPSRRFGSEAGTSTGLAAPGPTPSVSPPTPAAPTPPDGMVYVPGGSFMMGRDDGDEYERPAHSVQLKPFFIDAYEVTCGDYEKLVKETGRRPPPDWKNGACLPGAARKPVTGVSWEDANAYCQWAGGKRLPTEEQWEFAARGTDGRIYPWGNELKAGMANTSKAGVKGLADVGTFKGASPFGAFDMVGNAWEWTDSQLGPYTGGNITRLPPGDVRVIRGGSYVEDTEATTTYRGYSKKVGDKYDKTGFRCAKDAVGAAEPAP